MRGLDNGGAVIALAVPFSAEGAAVADMNISHSTRLKGGTAPSLKVVAFGNWEYEYIWDMEDLPVLVLRQMLRLGLWSRKQ